MGSRNVSEGSLQKMREPAWILLREDASLLQIPRIRSAIVLHRAEVLQHRHRGVAAVHADHAAPGMGARTAEIYPGHRGPSRKPVGPHIRRQAFALKDRSEEHTSE